tara:strand:- start:2677 stop:3096 length:420 start_codon:yes stop_codon:yes gene_type:complete
MEIVAALGLLVYGLIKLYLLNAELLNSSRFIEVSAKIQDMRIDEETGAAYLHYVYKINGVWYGSSNIDRFNQKVDKVRLSEFAHDTGVKSGQKVKVFVLESDHRKSILSIPTLRVATGPVFVIVMSTLFIILSLFGAAH